MHPHKPTLHPHTLRIHTLRTTLCAPHFAPHILPPYFALLHFGPPHFVPHSLCPTLCTPHFAPPPSPQFASQNFAILINSVIKLHIKVYFEYTGLYYFCRLCMQYLSKISVMELMINKWTDCKIFRNRLSINFLILAQHRLLYRPYI